jgi:transposase
MGRSRGGLTTKLHALVDAEGRPMELKLTAGQAHDGKAAENLLEHLGTDSILLADRAYDSTAIRTLVAERGAWANIPVRKNRKDDFAFSAYLYKYRNLVERFFGKIKQFRGIATRYDRNPENFLAAIKLASLRIWLKSYESTA